jgi:hypothetical protein
LVTLEPNNHPAPRGLTLHVSISSGSLHIKSIIKIIIPSVSFYHPLSHPLSLTPAKRERKGQKQRKKKAVNAPQNAPS